MKPESPAQPEPDAAVPRSESEQRLRARLRSYDTQGALSEERANADVAFATGHARGLEEGREAHLDSLRTVLLRILESHSERAGEEMLDQLESASLRELEDWIVRAASESTRSL